jgi:large conductance mechanosensitive channel
MDSPDAAKDSAQDAKDSAKDSAKDARDAKDAAQDAKDSAKDAKDAARDAAAAAKKVAFGSALAAKRLATEFRDFLLKTNMFALAMAVVIGNAISKVVDSLVQGLIMPVVGVLTPRGDWRSGLQVDVWRFHFPMGLVLGVLLDFTIIAGVVFLITKAVIRQAPPPPSKPCKMCLEAIHPDAKRCKFCTSEV